MPKFLIAELMKWILVFGAALWLWEHFSSWIVAIGAVIALIALLYLLRKDLPPWLGGDPRPDARVDTQLLLALQGGDIESAAAAIARGASADRDYLLHNETLTIRHYATRTNRLDDLAAAEERAVELAAES